MWAVFGRLGCCGLSQKTTKNPYLIKVSISAFRELFCVAYTKFLPYYFKQAFTETLSKIKAQDWNHSEESRKGMKIQKK